MSPHPIAYKDTEVEYPRSQMQINDLLAKRQIFNVQHTIGYAPAKGRYCIMVIFNYTEQKELENRAVPIRLLIPVNEKPGETEAQQKRYKKAMNQAYRALFYYLKTKFEALEFGFEFMTEFMPYIVVRGPDGQIGTIAELMLPQYQKALVEGGQGAMPMLPEILGKKDEEAARP